MKPTVHLHASCWNEERILPLFLRHYVPEVDRIFIYDDGSDDRSVDILRACRKVQIVSIDSHHGPSYVEALQQLYNDCWKVSRGQADWVIVANVDEHLVHEEGLRRYLGQCRRARITVVPGMGYDMISHRFPDREGDDTLNGEANNDTMNGGTGNDALNGGDGVDILNGDAGTDTLTGPPTDKSVDDVNGGANTDTCQGPGPDRDVLVA